MSYEFNVIKTLISIGIWIHENIYNLHYAMSGVLGRAG